MISVTQFKDYLLAKGFSINGAEFVKEYQMPPVDEESEGKTIKLRYVVDRPWVKGFRIDSVGREKLFAKGKLKKISIDETGSLTGFDIK